MHEAILQLAGLTEEQATVYEALITNGPMKAGAMSKKTPLKRGLAYYVLDQLVEMGLVEKEQEKGKIAVFRAMHPLKLREFLDKRAEQEREAQKALEGTLPTLISKFNLVSGMPGARFFEGVEGFKKVYDDKLATGKTIRLIRTVYEPVYQKQVKPIVHEFVKKRVKKGMSTIALTPPRPLFAEKRTHEDDLSKNYYRTYMKETDYTSPVEVAVYGDKMAILSYAQELVGVIIESPQIAKAFKEIFMLAKRGVTGKSAEELDQEIQEMKEEAEKIKQKPRKSGVT
jgi:predicted transcriptional regulator